MYPAKFDYHRANSIEEAVQLLAENGDAKLLAGGHSLIPAMKLRLTQPALLIDIGKIDGLKNIRANGVLEIGALATHARVAASAEVRNFFPALAKAASLIGDPQVRNFGTIGGNIAHADPASDPPTVLVAAGATIHVQGANGIRAVAAEDFFVDLFTTALEPGEVVTTIEIPNLSSRKSAYAKMPHPASRYAIVGVCAVLDMDGDTCRDVRLAVGGAVAHATRLNEAEAVLRGKRVDDTTLQTAAEAAVAQLGDEVMGDIIAPADYRRAMVEQYLKQAVHSALG
ncbi:MAG: xanthine dehydrogenase family protein subunit M [Anaerolineae bacterium]|nr:xanthine dehydrogenase family protein subunit M [Anaerolineae bacterium]